MTDKHKIAGILSIISGALGFLGGLGMAAFFILIFRTVGQQPAPRGGSPMPPDLLRIMEILYGVFGIAFALVGVLAIAGGILTLKRRHWGFALVGAIASSIAFYPTGIVAVIFTCLAKPEFQAREAMPSPQTASVDRGPIAG
ncbi:MAG: hypothetical protein HY673_15235 [Chloroflexi bacterium]|nr:hypothetical protein [Chloroflexota bacterium]